MAIGIVKYKEMVADFKTCDDEICALLTRIDKMMGTLKSNQDSIGAMKDPVLIQLRSAHRSCEKTMMSLIKACRIMS